MMKCSLKLMLSVLAGILLVSPFALKDAHFILKAGILSIPLVSLWLELNLYLQQNDEESSDGEYSSRTLQILTVYLSVVFIVVMFLAMEAVVQLGYFPFRFDPVTVQILLIPSKLIPYQTIVGFTLFSVVVPVLLFVIWKQVSEGLHMACIVKEKRSLARCILSVISVTIIFIIADLSLTIGISIVSLAYN